MILRNAGNYLHTDSLKSQKTWILTNETDSNYKVRCVTELLMAHSHW
jgi:hypothetical protein